ncbi:hypothetical protein [Streptomyces sp. 8K308]|uniref:hypothetical protein n=1 Tax=Streptomyces sp. 8K308 TaxID=2530388 RepID=UPI001FB6D77F|nr:hypothetical protein [Streptomyces sp. 8K308]
MTSSVSSTFPGWRRVVTAVGCAGLLAIGPVGCGGEEDPDAGTNGLASLTPAEIEERAEAAAGEATAVRLSGTVITEGESFRLDVRLGVDGGFGEVSAEGGETFELLRVEQDLYMKADAAFWESEGIPEELESDPAETLEGMYVRVAEDDPAYEQLTAFTDMNVLFDNLLTLDGEREVGERGEVDGTQTISVLADGGAGGTLDVALIGTPYPLRLQRPGEAGELLMSDWDEDFDLHAPEEDQILDYGDELVD